MCNFQTPEEFAANWEAGFKRNKTKGKMYNLYNNRDWSSWILPHMNPLGMCWKRRQKYDYTHLQIGIFKDSKGDVRVKVHHIVYFLILYKYCFMHTNDYNKNYTFTCFIPQAKRFLADKTELVELMEGSLFQTTYFSNWVPKGGARLFKSIPKGR